MVLIEKNKYLFELAYPDNSPENFRYVFQEFLKVDDLHGNMYMNKIYDWQDYQEYR
jgi:hypothetical protein